MSKCISVLICELMLKGEGKRAGSAGQGDRKWLLPSCHLGEHMVCIIQMGRVGSRMATPMLAKHSEPAETEAELLKRWTLRHPLLFAPARCGSHLR